MDIKDFGAKERACSPWLNANGIGQSFAEALNNHS